MALRRLPLLRVVLTGAMVGQERWDDLRALVWNTRVPMRDSPVQRVVDALHAYRPFDGASDLVTNALARTGESVETFAPMNAA